MQLMQFNKIETLPDPIDFLVFDQRTWQLVDHQSFQEITYDSVDQDVNRKTSSDHCPIVVEVDL
jgi:exonuclease III